VSVIHFVETKERMLAVRLPFPSGVPKPLDTMFGLTTPADMLAKFRWEIRQLTSVRHPDENPARLNGYRVFTGKSRLGRGTVPTVVCAWKSRPVMAFHWSTRIEETWNVFAKSSLLNVPGYTFAAGSRTDNP
jgi:hypothetical protein